MYVVYKATNIVNNKIYIGATNNLKRRMNEHKNHAKKDKSRFHDAILEYGFSNFSFEVLYECENKKEAFEKEVELIALYNTMRDDIGYNEIKGGIGGQTHDVSGKNNPMYGKVYTDEERTSLSMKLKGRIITQEHRDKISKGLKGKKKSETHVENLSKALKGNLPPNAISVSVINVNSNEILHFKSLAEMERTLKCSRGTLCKGNITRSGYKMYTEKSQETIEDIA